MQKFTKHILAAISVIALTHHLPLAAADSDVTELGRQLFFDNNLSFNRSQSCATCHNPAAGFVDDRDNGVGAAVSLGDDGLSLGSRSAPPAAYAALAPTFHYDTKTKQYIGGQFWDGRAKDLQEQAGGPPLNPLEMRMPNIESIKKRIQENSSYIKSFKHLYGNTVFDSSDKFYSAMTDAIATFERSRFFSPFDSKYDRYLKGEYELSAQEELGMALFFSNNNTNCSTCHALHPEGHPRETFTNYQFHNIGVPVNNFLREANIANRNIIDRGLLDNPAVDSVEHDGKFKVPTLRNVAITAPYMHNGVFKDLKTVMEFYDKYNNPQRVNNPETGKPWNEPEVETTINRQDLTARKLSDQKIDAIIAFLNTLTDKRYEYLLQTKE
jgi:cytochrome c peroxidase